MISRTLRGVAYFNYSIQYEKIYTSYSKSPDGSQLYKCRDTIAWLH